MQYYEALSYTWGDPSNEVTIYLDDNPFQVTKNLDTALRFIRQRREPRTLWIDAICINQTDTAERNVQVGHMNIIYSHASQVLVWLGESDPEVEEAMTMMKEKRTDESRFLQVYGPLYQGLTKMLRKTWWRRTWVIQEVILASQDPIVGCGHTWLKWNEVSKALMDFASSIMDGDRGWIRQQDYTWDTDLLLINQFALLRKHWKDGSVLAKERLTFTEILTRTRGHEATDARDQIFSILGLLFDEDRVNVPAPNYDKSVSQVYQETMVEIFKSNQNLEFLVHAPEGRQIELPSWCPDFSKRIWDWETYSTRGDSEKKADCRHNENLLTHDLHSGTLKVTGKILGKVALSDGLTSKFSLPGETDSNRGQDRPSYSNQHNTSEDEVQGALNLENFIHQVLNFTYAAYKGFEVRYGKEEAVRRIVAGQVWETVCKCYPIRFLSRQACARVGMKIEEEEDMPNEYSLIGDFVREAFPWYRLGLERVGLQLPAYDKTQRVGILQALSHTLILTVQDCVGYSWFLTQNGFIGRAERKIRADDLLCMICGCSAPLILRRCGDNSFKLVSMVRSTDRYEPDFQERVKALETREFVLL